MSFENMFRVLNISGSGLSAERTRMNVIAHNVANVNTLKTAEGGPYKKKEVNFEAVVDALASKSGRDPSKAMAGVRVANIAPSPDALKKVYNPAHSMADKDGYVTMPNVDTAMEMVDMISAARAYEANLAVSKSAKNMINEALRMGR